MCCSEQDFAMLVMNAKEADCRNGCCESLAAFGSSLIVAKKNNMGHVPIHI